MALIRKLCFRKRSRFHRRILGFLVIFGLSGMFLQGNVGVEEVHATGSVQNVTTDTSSLDQMSLVSIFDLDLKVVYILLWPLLVIAGWSLDNTLVYGSFFHMDAPLWKFRNMLKNFANFALGFIVLFSILKNIFSFGKADAKGPLAIIKSTLIAGVLIQASRFLTAALIDVSTVATYAVGGLPLTIMQNTTLGDQKILAVNSELDLNKFSNFTTVGDYYKVRYETKNKSGTTVLLSDCKIQSGYIIGRKDGNPKFANIGIFGTSGTNTNACVIFGNQVVLFHELPMTASQTDNISYQKELDRVVGANMNPDRTFLEGCNFFIKTDGPSAAIDNFTCNAAAVTDYATGIVSTTSQTDFQPYISKFNSLIALYDAKAERTNKTIGIAGGTKRFQNDTNAITISSLINKSKGFVGPLVTMYASMLNFAQMADVNPATIGSASGEMIIKAAFALAIFLPLLALAVVLILRIGFLWMVIAASPFLVLKETFKDIFGKIGGESLSFTNILGVIFAPVVTVFALSISLIFMTTLIKSYSPSNDGTTVQSALFKDTLEQTTPTHGGDQAYKIVGANTIEFKNLSRGGTLDRFSRMIVNFVAVGFIWVLLFAAIRANSLGKAIGEPIRKFGQGLAGAAKVIPMPAALGGRASISGITQGVKTATGTGSGTRLGYQNEKTNAKIAERENKNRGTGTTPPATNTTTTTTTTPVTINEVQAKNIATTGVTTGAITTEGLTPTQLFTNSANLPLLETAITNLGEPAATTQLENAAQLYMAEFKTQVEGGTYASATDIAKALNENNKIVRRAAEDMDGQVITDTKYSKTYTIKYGAGGTTTVTETTTGGTATQ